LAIPAVDMAHITWGPTQFVCWHASCAWAASSGVLSLIAPVERLPLRRFEFPESVNMYKYTAEGQAEREAAEASIRDNGASVAEPATPQSAGSSDKAVWYHLKGIVVHSGTAFAGHYYSYIKVCSLFARAHSCTLCAVMHCAPVGQVSVHILTVANSMAPFSGFPEGGSFQCGFVCVNLTSFHSPPIPTMFLCILPIVSLCGPSLSSFRWNHILWGVRRIEKANRASGNLGSGIALMIHQ
jgi:Ubiquitin carboxyl-terminal hydrolase